MAGTLRFLFILPTALVVLALYQDLFEAARLIANVLRQWTTLWSEVWRHVWGLLAPWGVRYPPDLQHFLTLATTLIAVIGFWPVLIRPLGLTNQGKTVRALLAEAYPRAAPWLISAVTMIVVLLASAVILFPFVYAEQKPILNTIGGFSSAVADHVQHSRWLLLGGAIASVLAITWILGDLVWSGFKYVMWFEDYHIDTSFPWWDVTASAAFVGLVVTAHSYLGANFSEVVLMLLSNVFLLGAIARTSAVSLVQIGSLVLGVLVLDAVVGAVQVLPGLR